MIAFPAATLVGKICKNIKVNMSLKHLLRTPCVYSGRIVSSGSCLQNARCFSGLFNNRKFIQKGNKAVSQVHKLKTNIYFSTRTTDSDSENEDDKNKTSSDVRSSLRERFVKFKDEDADEILDIEELRQRQEERYQREDEQFSIYEKKPDKLEGLQLERGVEGVFDIEELVDHLRQENLRDICVIAVPQEIIYTDYLVLVTAISPRHARAVTEFMIKLHKRKKSKQDQFVVPEGKNSADWQVMDMGNIVLHIFLQETRERYDIESLWTVGPEFDEKCKQQDDLLAAVLKHTFVGNLQPQLQRPSRKWN